MSIVGQDAFLKPLVRRYVTKPIPGLGDVRLQSISERERSEYEAAMLDSSGRFDKKAAGDSKSRLIVLCIVNEDGFRILGDHHLKTLPDMLDSSVADALYEACVEHCQVPVPETVEDVGKNLESSPPTAAEGSPSSLPTD